MGRSGSGSGKEKKVSCEKAMKGVKSKETSQSRIDIAGTEAVSKTETEISDNIQKARKREWDAAEEQRQCRRQEQMQ